MPFQPQERPQRHPDMVPLRTLRTRLARPRPLHVVGRRGDEAAIVGGLLDMLEATA